MARTNLMTLVKLIDSTVGELGVEEQFLLDLQKSIEITEKNNSRKPSQTFKPSSMNCMRMSYYQIKGAEADEKPMEAGFIGICESGTDRHERIQRAITMMKENDIDCEYVNIPEYIKKHKLKDIEVVSQQGMETKLFHKTLNMSFLCDGIIKYKDNFYIIEIKTENSRKFFDRSSVDPSHYKQAIAYSLVFDIDDVLFLYENRDVCSKKAFLFHVTGDMKQSLIGYIENTNSYLNDNKVPPKDGVEKKTCSHCKYKERCEKDGN